MTEPVVQAAPAPAPVAGNPTPVPVVAAPAPVVVAPVAAPAPVVAPVVAPAAPIVKPEAAPAAPVVVVPEPAAAVEVTLAPIEGSKLSLEDIEQIKAEVKDKGLTQVQAQSLLDQREGAARTQAGILDGFQKVSAGWQEAAMKDPELGGDATTFPAKMEHAKLGLAQMLLPEELAELDKSGFGNWPPMLRAGLRFYNSSIKSPNFVDGQPVTAVKEVDKSEAGRAARLFENGGRGPTKK